MKQEYGITTQLRFMLHLGFAGSEFPHPTSPYLNCFTFHPLDEQMDVVVFFAVLHHLHLHTADVTILELLFAENT